MRDYYEVVFVWTLCRHRIIIIIIPRWLSFCIKLRNLASAMMIRLKKCVRVRHIVTSSYSAAMDPSCEYLISYKIYEELILILCKFWAHFEWQFLRSEYYQLDGGAKRVFCVTGDQIKWFKTVLLLCNRDSWLGEWERGWFYVNFMWISIRTSQLKRDVLS